MSTSFESAAGQPNERVHLEKCKICGEWMNRLNLEEVVQHLDHSRRPGVERTPGTSSDSVKRDT